MKKWLERYGARRGKPAVCLGAAMLLTLSGCAGANNQQGPINPNLPVGLPAAPPPASSNSFTGTQSPGLWTVSIDDTQEQYSYQALTYPASPNTPTGGTFLQTIGFDALTSPTGGAGGYVAEVPGRAVLLEPGGDTVPPVFAVQQSSCFPINGNVRFSFVAMPSEYPNNNDNPSYGSIEAQTNADGTSWMFVSQAQYGLPITMGAPGTTTVEPGTPIGVETYLPTFPATCSVTNGNATITAAPNVSAIGANNPVSKLPVTVAVGPTGFFLLDQSTGTQPSATPSGFAPASFLGVIQPSSPLTTSSIVAPQYVGFLREAAFNGGAGTVISKTEPIGFGQVTPGAGTAMTGGTFLNEDITQFQNSNIVITLGTQDPANNGVYSLATLTVPDLKNVCVYDPFANEPGVPGGVAGVDQFGNETCTFNAVAVVGNPENKYAIFIAAKDVVNGGVPMGIYLFQIQQQ
jgi:hypothetical protein